MNPAGAGRTITELAPLVRAGAVSPVDLVRGCLDRIEARRDLNAFITVVADDALRAAEEAARDIAAGRYRGPLHGIPISLKDLIDYAGTPTTSGSNVPHRVPRVDAPVARRLREAGAIVVGKTNLHEFAFGTTSEDSAFGPVRHPLDPSRSPGGSSGGAAVALVEGMCYGSVGTDTGGSIRIPSAACGTVGLKPTAGELTCEGIVPLSTTLDHVGPMARTVADATLLFAAMGGEAGPPREGPAPVRIGVLERGFCDRLHPDVRRAFESARARLADAGHDLQPAAVAHAAWTADVYLHIVLPEASWYHAPMLDACPADYSPAVRLRLEMGRYVLAEDYLRAMRMRDRLTDDVDIALEGRDVLMLPTLPIPAPPLGAASVEVDGSREPVRSVMLRLTQLFDITGHPAIALPAGRDRDGFPVSVQLVGRRGGTAALLSVAAALEAQIAEGPGSVGGGTG
jgi:aspartyl-tRNA(Asn)/glutamyl-tRNA(Gln) amidotransferase subunit A